MSSVRDDRAGAPGVRPEAALLAELVRRTVEPVGVREVLDLVLEHLSGPCGVAGAFVVLATDDTFGEEITVGSTSPSAGTLVSAELRLLGRSMGTLGLLVSPARTLDPTTVAALAHHLALAARGEESERDAAFTAQATAAVRRLFEQGAKATSVAEAGHIVARVAAEALRTERSSVLVADTDGTILAIRGVGIPPEVEAALAASALGRSAGASPVWRATELTGTPVLADDVALQPGRPGGFAQTMHLLSYAALPLMSASGQVGMVVCGDHTRPRTWTDNERRLAAQLSLEAALVVDAARLRETERAHLDELTGLAHTDPLTGLPNRRSLLTAIEAALVPGRSVALLIADLDGFKSVNDTLGHHAGDQLLQEVALRLAAAVGASDVVARLGGDEFAVLCGPHPDGTAVADAADLAARLERVCAEPVPVDGGTARVTASIGVGVLAAGSAGPGAVTALLRSADARMYARKRGARLPV